MLGASLMHLKSQGLGCKGSTMGACTQSALCYKRKCWVWQIHCFLFKIFVYLFGWVSSWVAWDFHYIMWNFCCDTWTPSRVHRLSCSMADGILVPWLRLETISCSGRLTVTTEPPREVPVSFYNKQERASSLLGEMVLNPHRWGEKVSGKTWLGPHLQRMCRDIHALWWIVFTTDTDQEKILQITYLAKDSFKIL